MQKHVHAADSQHGGIEIVAVKGLLVKSAPGLFSLEDHVAVVFLKLLRGSDQEACCAAGRVANRVVCGGSRHINHQLNDVPWRPELAILPC